MPLLWPFLKALLLILPDLWNEVKTGRIRASSRDEVLNALLLAHDKRLRAARKARMDSAPADGIDPFDRNTQ